MRDFLPYFSSSRRTLQSAGDILQFLSLILRMSVQRLTHVVSISAIIELTPQVDFLADIYLAYTCTLHICLLYIYFFSRFVSCCQRSMWISMEISPILIFHCSAHPGLSAPPTFQFALKSSLFCSLTARAGCLQKEPVTEVARDACLSGGWDVFERRALSSLVISFPAAFFPAPVALLFQQEVSNLKIMVGRFYESRSGEETRAQTERISLSKDWCLVL